MKKSLDETPLLMSKNRVRSISDSKVSNVFSRSSSPVKSTTHSRTNSPKKNSRHSRNNSPKKSSHRSSKPTMKRFPSREEDTTLRMPERSNNSPAVFEEEDEDEKQPLSTTAQLTEVSEVAEDGIKVYCRIKPSSLDKSTLTVESSLVVKADRKYEFNRIFAEKSTQEDVYDAVARPMLENIVLGYNNTILAYGQSGCLHPLTRVVMFDGTTQLVRNIKIGDRLRGYRNTIRNVITLYTGYDYLYEVRFSNSNWHSFTVNSSHVLTIVENNKIVNISLKEALTRKKLVGINHLDELSEFTLHFHSCGEYNGFEIDGDNLFQVENGIITHNSGKTSTIQGYHVLMSNDSSRRSSSRVEKSLSSIYHPGILPRYVKDLFQVVSKLSTKIEVTVTISAVEIYLGNLQDLLLPDRKVVIREHTKGGTYLEGQKTVFVVNVDEAIQVIEKGMSNRTVTSTGLNKDSSRSHSLFFLSVRQQNETNGMITTSTSVFVDLAGSEKVSKTGAQGLVLEEAQNTNKSLTSLGMVIRALSEVKNNSNTHIPYRNSILTRILSDSLGGNCMTSMIITCSPDAEHYEETKSSLRFGESVRVIRNKPQMNREQTSLEYKKLLDQALKEIQELKASLQKTRRNSISLSPMPDLSKELLSLQETIEEKEKMVNHLEQEKELQRNELAEKELAILNLLNEKSNYEDRITRNRIENSKLENSIQDLQHQQEELVLENSRLKGTANDDEAVKKLKTISDSRQRHIQILEDKIREAAEENRKTHMKYKSTINELERNNEQLKASLGLLKVTKEESTIYVGK